MLWTGGPEPRLLRWTIGNGFCVSTVTCDLLSLKLAKIKPRMKPSLIATAKKKVGRKKMPRLRARPFTRGSATEGLDLFNSGLFTSRPSQVDPIWADPFNSTIGWLANHQQKLVTNFFLSLKCHFYHKLVTNFFVLKPFLLVVIIKHAKQPPKIILITTLIPKKQKLRDSKQDTKGIEFSSQPLPHKTQDHTIIIKHREQPINICLYHYYHFQKA